MTGRNVKIMECTLRDGSYAIDYQFTLEDSAIIAKGLENAGFEFIEFGHGLGLNASNAGEGTAAASDEEYLKVISSTISSAKYGMFFIPGIGRDQDLKMAADYGMDFVRIGVNATETESAARYIKLAKKLDMIVFTNLMKSYVIPPNVLAEYSSDLEKSGSDYIYLVDSAGGMLPQDVKKYIRAIKSKTSTMEIGFHGHNNLSLALANTLVAIESGASIVDSCLQGIGRSAGNTPTEILLMVLERMKISTGIDSGKTLDLGQKLIQPLIQKRGIDPIEITSGFAYFHSKNLKNILKYAALYDIDARELIKESSKQNQVEVSEDLLKTIVHGKLKKSSGKTPAPPFIFNNIVFTSDFNHMGIEEKTRKIGAELFSLSRKTGKKSIFTISVSASGKDVIFPFIRENSLCVIGNCEINTLEHLRKIIEILDGLVEIIFVDADKKLGNKSLFSVIRKLVKSSLVISYKDAESWARAADVLISQLIQDQPCPTISIFGCNTPSVKLAQLLAERGGNITLWDADPHHSFSIVHGLNTIHGMTAFQKEDDKLSASLKKDVLVGFSPGIPTISREMVMNMNPEGLVIDAGIGSIEQDAIQYAIDSGKKLYRLDMRAGLSGEITTILETKQLIEEIAGYDQINGVRVVAGGLIGSRGDIVIDSISQPCRIIGVANGTGGIMKDARDIIKYKTSIEKVKSGIMSSLL